jgi:hypothetical protein
LQSVKKLFHKDSLNKAKVPEFKIGEFALNTMINPFTDEYFMKKALQEAEMAFDKGEIPVGAIVVNDSDRAKS